ncbi:MAG: RimK family alpha-L-glutamate ligase [Planctomycetota bacterium]
MTKPSLRLGIITCQAAKLADYFPTVAEPELVPTEPPFTPDDQLLVAELRHRGHQVTAVVWGTPPFQLLNQFDRLIVRSPWDYMDRDDLRSDFLQWLDQLETHNLPVANEVPLMRWLMDKRYLLDFAAVGVPTVASELVERNQLRVLEDFVAQQGAAVIKPTISAAGVGLERLTDRTTARAFQSEFEQRCQQNAHLIQPFHPEIQTQGEWSLIYLGGEYSHAVHKLPAPGQFLVHAERGGSLRFTEPPSAVRLIGDQVASTVPQAFQLRFGRVARAPLYLRIDLLETARGVLLSECEGVEPELFFRARPGSPTRCAELIELGG